MIKFYERDRQVLPAFCVSCGYYLVRNCEEFCDECGQGKMYEIECPECEVINVKINIVSYAVLTCTTCHKSLPNVAELAKDKEARILYHIRKGPQNEKITIH